VRAAACDLLFYPNWQDVRSDFFDRYAEFCADAAGMFGPAERGLDARFGDFLRSLDARTNAEYWHEYLLENEGSLIPANGCQTPPPMMAVAVKILRPEYQDFREQQAYICGQIDRTRAAAFCLGEAVESGALPDLESWTTDPSQVTPPPQAQPNAAGSRQWLRERHHRSPDGHTSESTAAEHGCQQDRGAGDATRLEPPLSLPFSRPWSTGWIDAVRRHWRECGLPGPPALECFDDKLQTEASRRQVFEGIVTLAKLHLQAVTPSGIKLEDRLRIIDEGARQVMLDGVFVAVDNSGAFAMFVKIYRSPGHHATAEEIRQTPACRGKDFSKVVSHLPPALREIIKSSGGRASVYSVQLPPLSSW
jgi:hypothetical protein